MDIFRIPFIFGSMDLEKAFDRVPREVIGWAMHIVIVMEAISREFRVALPWELLYADDLAVIAETEEELIKSGKIMWRVKA